MNRSSLFIANSINQGTGSFSSSLDNTSFPQSIDSLENVLKVLSFFFLRNFSKTQAFIRLFQDQIIVMLSLQINKSMHGVAIIPIVLGCLQTQSNP